MIARKVRCANCGYVMRSSKSAPEKGGRHYLCCSNRHVSPDACIGSFVSVDRLERMVSRSYYVDRGRGDLSESDFIDILQGLKSKRERIKQMIVENERAMAEIERKIAIGDNRRELVEQYANVDHLTREMVEHQLVKK